MAAEPRPWCSLVCYQKDTKFVKTVLEENCWLDKARKIEKYVTSNPLSMDDQRPRSLVPTMLSEKTMISLIRTLFWSGDQTCMFTIADQVDVKSLEFGVNLELLAGRSPLHRSLLEWAKSWYSEDKHMWATEEYVPPIYDLLQNLPASYTVHHPMLLLSPGSLSSDVWKQFLFEASDEKKITLLSRLAGSVNCTHVAINAYIPAEAMVPVKSQDESQDDLETMANVSTNEIRSPVNLTRLFGDFGPFRSTLHPTTRDLDCAFWVQTKQNGIKQTWAPVHTMFSRGNVKEKARLLNLVPKKTPITKGDFTVIDLYAGIGYFAFSYAKAGAAKVLCWELNGWSVEGLRRGASLNNWDCDVVLEHDEINYERVISSLQTKSNNSKLIAFHENNKASLSTISQLIRFIPPIRHVNCGLLPTSRGSWKTAVKAISIKHGGWIHLHENIRTDQLVQILADICLEIQRMVEEVRHSEFEVQIRLDHVEQVKSYAPGVKHCVLDIFIPPAESEYEVDSDIDDISPESDTMESSSDVPGDGTADDETAGDGTVNDETAEGETEQDRNIVDLDVEDENLAYSTESESL